MKKINYAIFALNRASTIGIPLKWGMEDDRLLLDVKGYG